MPTSRRFLAVALAAACLSAMMPQRHAAAFERLPYDEAAFRAAASAGRPILVDITAPWCPTCRAQRPILERLLKRPEFEAMAVFDVDFDREKARVKALGATMQSTLIAFKAGKPVGRSVGDTRESSIATLLESAL